MERSTAERPTETYDFDLFLMWQRDRPKPCREPTWSWRRFSWRGIRGRQQYNLGRERFQGCLEIPLEACSDAQGPTGSWKKGSKGGKEVNAYIFDSPMNNEEVRGHPSIFRPKNTAVRKCIIGCIFLDLQNIIWFYSKPSKRLGSMILCIFKDVTKLSGFESVKPQVFFT